MTITYFIAGAGYSLWLYFLIAVWVYVRRDRVRYKKRSNLLIKADALFAGELNSRQSRRVYRRLMDQLSYDRVFFGACDRYLHYAPFYTAEERSLYGAYALALCEKKLQTVDRQMIFREELIQTMHERVERSIKVPAEQQTLQQA